MEGNAAFGSTIMSQEKFQTIKYVQGEGEAMMEVNLPEFRKMTPLLEEEEYFEIEKDKKMPEIEPTHTNWLLYSSIGQNAHEPILL